MRLDSLYIAGVGSYLPPLVDCADAVRDGLCSEETYKEGGWLSAAVAGDTSPVEMAADAGEVALERSGIQPADVDFLLYAWATPQGPHMWLPQHFVERRVVGRDIPAIGIQQGCVGMWTGVELGASLLQAPGRRAVIVAGGENRGVDPSRGADPTFRWQYAHGARTNRASVSGDCGVALVLSNQAGFAKVLSVTSGSLSEFEEVYRAGEPLFPPEYHTDRPVRMGVRVKAYADRYPERAPGLMQRLNEGRTATARTALREARVEPGEITRVLHVHAGSEPYVEHILDPLGIAPERGMLEFGRRVGHLSLGDQVASLDHLMTTGQLRVGDRVLVIANGIGVALASAVLEIVDWPDWAGAERA